MSGLSSPSTGVATSSVGRAKIIREAARYHCASVAVVVLHCTALPTTFRHYTLLVRFSSRTITVFVFCWLLASIHLSQNRPTRPACIRGDCTCSQLLLFVTLLLPRTSCSSEPRKTSPPVVPAASNTLFTTGLLRSTVSKNRQTFYFFIFSFLQCCSSLLNRTVCVDSSRTSFGTGRSVDAVGATTIVTEERCLSSMRQNPPFCCCCVALVCCVSPTAVELCRCIVNNHYRA